MTPAVYDDPRPGCMPIACTTAPLPPWTQGLTWTLIESDHDRERYLWRAPVLPDEYKLVWQSPGEGEWIRYVDMTELSGPGQ